MLNCREDYFDPRWPEELLSVVLGMLVIRLTLYKGMFMSKVQDH